jgi:hypothetical protein
MQVMQGAELLAEFKTEGSEDDVGDHKPVVMPNTLAK